MEKLKIRWNAVLEGCLSLNWENAQQAYFKEQKSTGLKWQVAMCRRIWMIPWAMWRHWNNNEHLNDITKETARVDLEIQEELPSGFHNNDDIWQMMMESWLSDLSCKSLSYKRGWLRGLKALGDRNKRRGLTEWIVQGMWTNLFEKLFTSGELMTRKKMGFNKYIALVQQTCSLGTCLVMAK